MSACCGVPPPLPKTTNSFTGSGNSTVPINTVVQYACASGYAFTKSKTEWQPLRCVVAENGLATWQGEVWNDYCENTENFSKFCLRIVLEIHSGSDASVT